MADHLGALAVRRVRARGQPMTAPTPRRAPGGVHTLRRVILLLLLAILVSVAATGIEGLLRLVLDAPRTLEESGSQLAQAIASTAIAVPLGAGLYLLIRRWLTTFHDRHSVLWPVYLATFGTVALLIGLPAMLNALAELVSGSWEPAPFATGLVWLTLWAWHAWMWRSPSQAPTRLVDVGPTLGSLVGLGFAIGGLTGALQLLFGSAVLGPAAYLVGVETWWVPVLQRLVWALGGAAVWWWHWHLRGVRASRAGFAGFALIVVAGFATAALALGGTASALYSVIALTTGAGLPAFDTGHGADSLLRQLAEGVAVAVVAALVWAYHRRIIAAAPTAWRWTVRLVASGVGLAFAASGLGVVVNALLASLGDTLAGDWRSLLFGGLAALLVGGAAWWRLWLAGTASPVAPGFEEFSGRRAYLVTIFGVSAVTAVITLLVIAYGVLQAALGVSWSGSMVENIRAPLGLLTATALVAAYHFAVWRRSRPAEPATPPAPRIGRVTLVAHGESAVLIDAIEKATGASVEHWPPRESGTATDADAIVSALAEVSAQHVLVIARQGLVEVVPVASSPGQAV